MQIVQVLPDMVGIGAQLHFVLQRPGVVLPRLVGLLLLQVVRVGPADVQALERHV